ncbi:MAG: hypothetical protein V4722_01715 [Bacteroidota bacterium]
MLLFFQKVIDVLNASNIPYMLSGSVAMGTYILPRATRDFVFIVHLQQADIDSFVEQFKEGYYCDSDAIRDAVKHRSMFNIIDHHSGYKADFMILKNEDYRQTEFKRRVQMEYFGKSVYIVSAEDLLLSKLIWIQTYQSALQMEDIRNLTKLEPLDWSYIREWIKKLRIHTFNLLPE